MQRLNRLPVVDPPPAPPLPLSQTFHQVIREAQKQQKQQNDQFVAIDHLILALLKGSELPEICKAASVDLKALESELRRKRGGRKVDSRGAEAQFEALAKCELTLFPVSLHTTHYTLHTSASSPPPAGVA
jgi:ATP-dependent Clp protease ATP-binding subunit ClpB